MPDAALLTRGQVTGLSMGTGTSSDTDIQCAGDATLVVQADLTGSAAGDLSPLLYPFEMDNTTVAPIAIPPLNSVGPTVSGGHVYYYAQYDIVALDRVRIHITNNNAGTQTLTRMSWRLA